MATRFYVLSALLVVLGGLGFARPSPIAGIFETTPLLNVIHLIAGLTAGVAARRGLGTMRRCGQILGYLFAALAVAGFATDAAFVHGLLPLSAANAWFHLALTLVFLYYALLAPPTL